MRGLRLYEKMYLGRQFFGVIEMSILSVSNSVETEEAFYGKVAKCEIAQHTAPTQATVLK